MGNIHPVEGKSPQTQLNSAHNVWDIGIPRLDRIGKLRIVIMGT